MLDVLPIVVPVARKPKQLWSLWDMVDSFGISELNTHLVNLERACAFVQLILEPMNPEFDRPRLLVSSVPQFQTAIEGIVQTCTHAGLPLSAPVQGGWIASAHCFAVNAAKAWTRSVYSSRSTNKSDFSEPFS